MIAGYPYEYGAVKSADVSCLSGLLDGVLKIRNNNDNNIPNYITSFFSNFCSQIDNISMNVRYMDLHSELAHHNAYCFVKLKKLFWCNGCMNFVKFIKVFKTRINEIAVFFRRGRAGYVSSMKLDDAFVAELIKMMEYVNSAKAIRSRFKHLIVVKPEVDNLDAFINVNKDSFIKKYGWMLERKPYNDIAQNAQCDNAIYIFPIT